MQESNEQIERQRAEAALPRQIARFTLLHQITRAISNHQDPDSILHFLLRQLEDHTGLDFGVVALFDELSQTLNVAALRVKDSRIAAEFDLQEGTGFTLAEIGLQLCGQGETVHLHDPRNTATPFAARLTANGWHSCVAVPLVVKSKLFGVLIAARREAGGFSNDDIELLRMLSEHTATTAHQTRKYKELERSCQELRETQALVVQQERLKALGQMASGIAHDINNALSPVVGYSDLLLHSEPGLSSSVRKYLNHIRTAGEDIAHIVARLREFYRKRPDQTSLLAVNLNALIEQVVDLTRPRWYDIPQSSGVLIELETRLAVELPSLAGVEGEIREAFTNLIVNAVEAMPAGGKITLRTQVVLPGAASNNSDSLAYVIVEFGDTGTGMDEETRKRCLEPFFSTKGKRGTGLGLAMVYGVMERHEGRIEIRSESGKGSTFRLLFPVRSVQHAIGAEDRSGTMPKPMHILCIDDEPLLRELIKEILERDGHTVEVSDCGQTGLDAFRHARERGQPFDVVFTDLGMPYMDGKQVARMLKHESPSTPVVMLTGWGAFMKEDGDAPGQVDSVISKPPRSKELRETLYRLQSARAAAPG